MTNFILTSSGPLPLTNQLENLPVELVRMIAASLKDEEDIATFSLCNQDLFCVLKGMVTPKLIAYVAACGTEPRSISMAIRKLGANTMTQALTMDVNGIYALEAVARGRRTDIYRVLQPFVTRGHESILRAFKESVSLKIKLAKLAVEAFRHICNYSTALVAAALLPHMYPHLRVQACTGSLEGVVTSGEVDLLQVLINGGANLDTFFVEDHIPPDRHTALHWLAMYGLWSNKNDQFVEPMVRMLTAAGANVNAVDFQGRTPLHELALGGSQAVIEHYSFPDELTTQTVEWTYKCTLGYLFRAGADVNMQDDLGMTALHFAVKKQETVMIELLLAHGGINVLLENHEGIRASMMSGEDDFQILAVEQDQMNLQ
ncbi:uncharacterized protein H6S33_008118 [Morchella sextelata]|uniref:uncharacterized protein n=1 Tax=Morchella sextelata TaxID=1174677 RepID=UPI001D059FDE|nr:uncharacterized protein H6S33_008118 [Morchella sextelata]KAH0603114.1 hypothetical protein H6S33_008118 [Morchella sextelata]